MMTLAHAAVGSLVGGQTGNPYLAFTIGLVLHIAMDKVPHFWPKKNINKLFFLSWDWLLVFGLIIFIFKEGYSPAYIWGGIGGACLDLISIAVPKIQKMKIPTWHRERQPHKNMVIFLLVDLAVILPTIIAIWWLG